MVMFWLLMGLISNFALAGSDITISAFVRDSSNTSNLVNICAVHDGKVYGNSYSHGNKTRFVEVAQSLNLKEINLVGADCVATSKDVAFVSYVPLTGNQSHKRNSTEIRFVGNPSVIPFDHDGGIASLTIDGGTIVATSYWPKYINGYSSYMVDLVSKQVTRGFRLRDPTDLLRLGGNFYTFHRDPFRRDDISVVDPSGKILKTLILSDFSLGPLIQIIQHQNRIIGFFEGSDYTNPANPIEKRLLTIVEISSDLSKITKLTSVQVPFESPAEWNSMFQDQFFSDGNRIYQTHFNYDDRYRSWDVFEISGI